MIGAILGDLVGSIYENENTRSYDFPLFTRFSRFTDDTVLTVAIADAILHRESARFRWLQPHHNRQMYALRLKAFGRRYPQAGYGQQFQHWFQSDSLRGYGSFGNGAAMRVSAIGYAFDQLKTVLREAHWSAVVTHNHVQGVKGAQAVAGAVFLARTGTSKAGIRDWVENRFGYNLHQNVEALRQTYTFDSSCQGSVPQAFIAFFESRDYEDAIRKAVSIGGDSDTIACMCGAIAHAYYRHIPAAMLFEYQVRIPADLQQVVDQFNDRFGIAFP